MKDQTVTFNQPVRPNITLTPNALSHLKRMIERKKGLGMRLTLKKAGCSGYMYKVELLESIQPDEATFALPDNLTLAVPQKWLPFLNGTEIDYVKTGMGQQFKFKNPNESIGCGCGESFAIAQDPNDDAHL